MKSPDVVVIGGGPAGTTAASMSARAGLSVVLLERERFPRDHIGESLLPASMPILEELGVDSKMSQAGFLPKYGATMVWGKSTAPWTWKFSETNLSHPHAYQVIRGEFDQILLERSKELGVDVREGCNVREIIFDAERAVGVRYDKSEGDEVTLPSSFVIDASGQSALLAHHRNMRKWDEDFRNLAIYTYFRGCKGLAEPDQINIFIESFPYGWMWFIPLKGELASVGAVVDSEKAVKMLNNMSEQDFFDKQLSTAPYTYDLVKGADQVVKTTIVKDWSYEVSQMAGPGWATAGDAACFIDPLFSSGVHIALMSGVLASAYAVTSLKCPDMESPTAVVYEDMIRREYCLFKELARLFYSSNRSVDSYYWETRKIVGDTTDRDSRTAFIRAVSGQSVRGYERAVLERGDLDDSIVEGLKAVSEDFEMRRRLYETVSESILGLIPVLDPETRVEKKPVLSEGRFEWGTMLYSPKRVEGTVCSRFVELLINSIDGETNVSQIISILHEQTDDGSYDSLTGYVTRTLRILFVEGALCCFK